MFYLQIRTVVPMECPANIAWGAVHDPAVAAKLYWPLLQMRVKSGVQLPQAFVSGSQVDVALYLLGRFCVGSQRITIENLPQVEFAPRTRTMRDAGRPLSGPLALLKYWNHEISICPTRSHTAIWNDELTIGGIFAPVFFVLLKPMWHWRGAKLRRLARHWADEHQLRQFQGTPPPKAQCASKSRTFITALALRKAYKRHDPHT